MDDGRKMDVARRIRAYIEAKGLSRARFAERAGISLSSVNNIVRGIFTEKLLDKVEAEVKERFRLAGVVARQSLPSLGAYDYEDVRHYEGQFELVRRDMKNPAMINVYCMSIGWSDDVGGMAISHQKLEETRQQQIGALSFPKEQSFVFIMQSARGWQQLSILEKMDVRRIMRGATFALGNTSGRSYEPALLPFCLVGYEGEERRTRSIPPGAASHAAYAQLLASSDEFVRRDVTGSGVA